MSFEPVDMIDVIGEGIVGDTAVAKCVSMTAHQYDGHDFIREHVITGLHASLAAEGVDPAGVRISEQRWTMNLGSEDPA